LGSHPGDVAGKQWRKISNHMILGILNYLVFAEVKKNRDFFVNLSCADHNI